MSFIEDGVTYLPELNADSFDERGYCTVCMDTELVLEHKGTDHSSRFLLCRMDRINADRTCHDLVYALFVHEDRIPILISDETAEQIMKDPKVGEDLVFNREMDRHR